MVKIIDGKLVSASVKASVKEVVRALNEKNVKVTLAVILVGENPASLVYVNNKQKTCKELGIESRSIVLPADYGQENLLELIRDLNADAEINGILCQLPLPDGYNESEVIAAIDPAKDVDAFHPINVGHIVSGDYKFLPCTPAGIMEMLNYYDVDVTGKHCVVIGRSNIVGKPMSMLLLNKNGTVTVCHSKTKGLDEICRQADILVAAVGRPNFVTADMVKDGAIVIDVGINRVDGKLVGDVDFENVSRKTSLITPVPGGVGPMTIAMLMQNTVAAAISQSLLA